MKAKQAALLAFLLALAAGCGREPRVDAPVAAPGATVPATPGTFRMPPLTGSATLGISDFRGKVVLVNFFVSGSESCRDEMLELNALQATYAARGFSVFGVAMDLKPPVYVASDLRSAMPTFPCAVGGREARQVFGSVKALPTRWLLDPEGRTVKVFEGAAPLEGVRKELDRLLP